MIINALEGLPPPAAPDVKVEKKKEKEEIKPVEGSDEGFNTELDTNKQNSGKAARTKYNVENGDVTIKVYNAKGNLVRKIPQGYPALDEQESLSVVV